MPSFEPPSTTHSSRTSSFQSDHLYPRAPSSRHLRPEDAFPSSSPPYQQPRSRSPLGRSDTVTAATAHLVNTGNATRKHREKRRGRSSSRRRHRPWKKLLWVKQSYPDNYTDEETFLDHLQRNPRLQPYEFWTLVADSTIIVQHVCSVIIFVSCFTGIFQERVSPNAVVGWATFGTVAGWVLRDYWHTMEEEADDVGDFDRSEGFGELREEDLDAGTPASLDAGFLPKEPALSTNGAPSRVHSRNPSITSVVGSSQPQSPREALAPNGDAYPSPAPSPTYIPPYNSRPSSLSPKMIERLATAKSAILIYFSLLGLSPILKSLTKSTSSDSIWALSSWLMCINVFTFDYGAGPEAKFPASLSTNAALMASTVLASRLPSTTHVFSLTLFSIEVFGLFPVFRRHLKHHSWPLHLTLTIFLIVLASGGLGMVISGGGLGYAVLGVILGGVVTLLGMGATSWWLIGLQRYKNEIHGPWDPARPVIRRHWD